MNVWAQQAKKVLKVEKISLEKSCRKPTNRVRLLIYNLDFPLKVYADISRKLNVQDLHSIIRFLEAINAPKRKRSRNTLSLLCI